MIIKWQNGKLSEVLADWPKAVCVTKADLGYNPHNTDWVMVHEDDPEYGRLSAEYPDQVNFTFRDYPVISPVYDLMAAKVAQCVLDQDQELFWAFHDALYTVLGPGDSGAGVHLLAADARSGGVPVLAGGHLAGDRLDQPLAGDDGRLPGRALAGRSGGDHGVARKPSLGARHPSRLARSAEPSDVRDRVGAIDLGVGGGAHRAPP